MVGKSRLDLGGIIVPKGAAPPIAMAPQRGPEPKPQPAVPATSGTEERMVALTVKIPASLYAKLRHFAVDHGRTHQDVGLAALRAYLDKQPT
jgi:hypothetical protein